MGTTIKQAEQRELKKRVDAEYQAAAEVCSVAFDLYGTYPGEQDFVREVEAIEKAIATWRTARSKNVQLRLDVPRL